MTRRHGPRSLAMRTVLVTVVACAAARSASAQLVTYTTHFGQDTAYCGLPTGGPVAQHTLTALAAVHDAVSVSDPGGANWPPSAASAQIDSVPSSSGISIHFTGSSTRGVNANGGAYATGDDRETWEFSVASPVRFSFSVSLSASSTESTVPLQAYAFGALGGGAQIVADPGTPPGAFASSISAPGTFAVTAGGTLMPGSYSLTLVGRCEGNTSPFNGSFDHSLALGLGCGSTVSYCTSGTTTHGCTPHIAGNGTASASAASGFTLDVTGMEGAAPGLIFYGVSGRTASPWGASSSFVCVLPPTQRTGAQAGSGAAGSCNGTMSVDWNLFVAGHPNALGAPFSAGQLVDAQGWFRDPPSPKSTMLTDALEFPVCP